MKDLKVIGQYTARIVLARTGTAVDSVQELYEGSTDYGLYYLWADGNYSCDCNRSHMFRCALYPTPPINDPHWNNHAIAPCNSGPNRRYRVPYLLMPDGERMTIDEQPATEGVG